MIRYKRFVLTTYRYEVFNIKTKNRKDKEGKEREGKPETPELNKKLIRNNIKFKIKNLLNTYLSITWYKNKRLEELKTNKYNDKNVDTPTLTSTEA